MRAGSAWDARRVEQVEIAVLRVLRQLNAEENPAQRQMAQSALCNALENSGIAERPGRLTMVQALHNLAGRGHVTPHRIGHVTYSITAGGLAHINALMTDEGKPQFARPGGSHVAAEQRAQATEWAVLKALSDKASEAQDGGSTALQRGEIAARLKNMPDDSPASARLQSVSNIAPHLSNMACKGWIACIRNPESGESYSIREEGEAQLAMLEATAGAYAGKTEERKISR